MGCYLRCRNCNSNLYLQQQKDELRFPISVSCSVCGFSGQYGLLQVTQERHDYECIFCQRFFYIRRTPPCYASCPHCNSSIYISSDNALTLLRAGTRPNVDGDTVGGLAGGALIGSALGPGGALLGGLLGALLGRLGLSREAQCSDGL